MLIHLSVLNLIEDYQKTKIKINKNKDNGEERSSAKESV